MSRQVTLWLPDHVVALMDEMARSSPETSRAEVVAQAVRHEKRRRDDEIALLTATREQPDQDDVAGFVAYSTRVLAGLE